MQFKLFLLLSLLGFYLPGYAQTFFEDNADGISVYYTITSAEERTVEISRPSTPYSGIFTIPENVVHSDIQYQVTGIGDNAFASCNSLASVYLPGSIRRIGARAFYACSNLRALELSEGLVTIGKEAFRGASLPFVTIPSSVTTIGEGVFSNNLLLKEIVVNKNNMCFCTEKGILLDYSKKLLHTWPGGNTDYLSFPQSVTQINGYAFYQNDLSSITIPEGVVSIGDYAFGRNKLTFVSLPSTLRTMASDAFSSSYTINHVQSKAVEVPFTGQFIPSFGPSSRDVVFEVPGQSLSAYEKAWGNGMYVTMGATEQEAILNEAGTLASHFNEGKLSTIFRLEITGPINGSDIATMQKMNNLLKLDLSKTTIVSGGDAYESYQIETSTSEKVYTKDNHIGEYMFSSISSKLREVILPSSIISIGNGAFYGCEISSIEIPSTVTGIGRFAFRACSKLLSVRIPENTEFTGESVFRDCSSLREITFAGEISELPYKLFDSCTSLYEVILPEGLKTIGTEAFLNCTSLSSLTLPQSIEVVGGWCLDKCTSLNRLEVRNPIPCTVSSYSFYGVPTNTCTLYVPAASISDYKGAEYWKLFNSIIALEDGPSSLERIENKEQANALTIIPIKGGVTLVAQKPQEVCVYDLNGKILIRLFLTEKETYSLCDLPQGIYLINGKKVVVR